ncbi:FAD binding domain-containing protein [Neptuniibacter sp.]|uniref:FAD binding domain-containing protein n=1 Tax=Neptuniibacter sp. TaxID=1962643 RepID=UPI00263965CF|nr:FAD binding domain-containing protein [Neptuniibacter sp.]
MSSRILPNFDLLVPNTIAETVNLLAHYKDRAAVIAGGTDLVVAMKMNFESEILISISELSGLDYIDFDSESGLHIGAKATVSQLLQNDAVKQHYPALLQAADVFATPQIRTAATVAGNVLRGSPAGDCSCALMALGARVVLQSAEGTREVPIEDFWTGYNQNARRADEMAVEIIVDAPQAATGSAFRRMTRVNEDLAKLNGSVRLDMDGNICRSARIAMGCVGPTTLRLPKTEQLLQGEEITDDLLAHVADIVPTEISPIDDKRSTAEYRLMVSGVVIKRLIEQAAAAASTVAK